MSFRAGLLVVTLVAACASNDRVPTTSEEYDDLAITLAATIRSSSGHGDLVAMTDVVALANGFSLPGFKQDASGQQGERAGVGYRYAMTCRDSIGEMASCVGATNAIVAAGWSGALELPFQTLAMERDGAWSLAGIGSDLVVLNGYGDMTYHSRVTSPDRETVLYDLSYAATYEGIELGRDAAAPRAGTVVYEIDADIERMMPNRTHERSIEATAVLTFEGHGSSTLVIDDERTYSLDLITGSVVGR